ncbi:unnamed protein product (macronuclear) [Paramecium tetraurelia]|uniref:Uncharacterized protein n=1 Tax=Paramecium tetraurelia TaxID=5888 RepID=A0CQK3_PARTE|nr:uncharacterized protein GSPATT00009418001 [Paramecium tetraurelia]CAK73070.1 unnamed protein product [Paramecium tetraurelia]|eukprot:XP_001440467.1 hypothetical protein (macronuclear) [Paramecium tetraurelia strain d4-2]
MKQQIKQDESAQPMIILQPSQYKFMIFMDSSLQKDVDKLYNKHIKQVIDKERIEKIQSAKDEVKSLREIINDYQTQQNEIDSLKSQLQNQIKAILSKEQIIKNIEDTYMQQMEEIKNNYEQRQFDLVKECEQLKLRNKELEEINTKYLALNDLLLKANNNYQQRVNELEMKLILAEKNNLIASSELEQMKEIRAGALFIQGAYKILKYQYQESNIYTLLTNKYKSTILSFLEPKDIFDLMLTSKQMYFIIQNNRSLLNYIVNYRTQVLNKEIKFLKTEFNYFNDMVYQIPEEIIQIGIAKFLVFKFNIGQYMNEIFNDAYELIEGKFQNQQQQLQQQQQQIQSDSLYQNEDLLGLGETDEQQQQKQQNSTQYNVASTASSIFTKIKSYAGNHGQSSNKNINASSPSQPSQNKQAKSLSDLSIQLQQEYQDIDSLILESLQVPFLKAQIIQTRREMVDLVKKSLQINQQLFQTGRKCIPTPTYQPKFTMQDFMQVLQMTFSKFVAHGHYLHLESQQLLQTCNYFSKLLLLQHKQIYQLKSQIDDQKVELDSQKEMKYYIQDRAKRFEERIIKAEEQIFTLNKLNFDQKSQITSLQKKEKELEDLVKEKETKTQTLFQAVKQIKIEKDQVETKLNQVLMNFKNMKNALGKIV